ncbi:MAG: protease modulator HflC [Azovibrio sp.]
MNAKIKLIGILVAVLLVVGSMSMFTVDQREYALVFQLGEVRQVIMEPGLKFKVPLVQNVRFFDRRVQVLDSREPERFITSEKKNVLVDSFVKWRIVDPKLYYVSVAGDETRTRVRLSQTINDGLRGEFAKRTVHDVVSGERDQIMENMRGKADADARKIGVQILDVRLKRVELPQDVSESVFRRMEAERKQVANMLRSEGAAEAERIRADADRQREVILADAYRDAQKIKGDGDAQAAAIYARAFGQNPEFFAFYRSMEAYRGTFSGKNNVIVLEPNSDFFRFFNNAK